MTSSNMYLITIQDSFEDVICDVENGAIESEKFWLARRSVNDANETLQYFKINASLRGGKTLKFEGESETLNTRIKFEIEANQRYIVTIEDELGTEKYTLITPNFKKLFGGKDQITLVEYDKLNKEIIQGTLSGDILVHNQNTFENLGRIKLAHLSSVRHLVLLPSGKVLMSVGDDFRICLWDLSAGLPTDAARTFMSQSKTITDIALIGRGRNFVTASEDGSVAIWECSSGRIVTEFRRITNRTDPVKCMALASSTFEPEENQFRAELLFECLQKVVFAGYELGLIQQYSVARNCPTDIKLHGNSAVTSLRACNEYVIAGHANGLIVVWNWVKGTTQELQLNKNHPIEHIYIRGEQSGLSFVLSNGPESLLRIELNGSKFDISYLVGLQEMFHVLLIGECISTDEEVAIY